MANYDWSRFVTRISIKASNETIYKAWATQFGMELWFLRSCEYKNPNGDERKNDEMVQKGDSYKWLWHGWLDDTVEHGKIVECNNKDVFKFSFGKAGNCTVNLREEEGETIVELLQDEIPTDEAGILSFHLGCKSGWTFYLTNLKSIYEGGIDLRNKNVKLKGMLNS